MAEVRDSRTPIVKFGPRIGVCEGGMEPADRVCCQERISPSVVFVVGR
ncbi:hypothetical protein RBSWK_04485 [Rhodopirellula baltica SWK14]|uniref:Uncharacterized protein n=1 Tax=Rhodopirellula baltica SWK14 TaxID=993516 RepID=L7CBJ8_RHOBT|nr:hypothetical protein RBSWK_04485 [Rhodopirellula baltica SWK14]